TRAARYRFGNAADVHSGRRVFPSAQAARWSRQRNDRHADRATIQRVARHAVWLGALVSPALLDLHPPMVACGPGTALKRSRLRMTAITTTQTPRAAMTAQRKLRPAPLEYGRRTWLRTVMVVSFVFLYAPIFTLVAFSFNNSKRNVTWEGFTFD